MNHKIPRDMTQTRIILGLEDKKRFNYVLVMFIIIICSYTDLAKPCRTSIVTYSRKLYNVG
jgi:hypothetical protein